MNCNCDEAFIESPGSCRRSRLFPQQDRKHDCEYIIARDKLIPEAERIASSKFKRYGPESGGLDEWSRLFHESMSLLWQHAKEEKGANEKTEEEGQQEREADSLAQIQTPEG